MSPTAARTPDQLQLAIGDLNRHRDRKAAWPLADIADLDRIADNGSPAQSKATGSGIESNLSHPAGDSFYIKLDTSYTNSR